MASNQGWFPDKPSESMQQHSSIVWSVDASAVGHVRVFYLVQNLFMSCRFESPGSLY